MIECCGHGAIHSSQSLLRNIRSFSILLYLSYSPISKVAVGNGLGQVEGRYRWFYFFYLLRFCIMPAERDDAINQLQTLSA